MLSGVQADGAAGTNGGLDVTLGGKVVEHLNLAGDYTAARFTVAHTAAASTVTADAPTPPARHYLLEGPIWPDHAAKAITWSFAASTYAGDTGYAFSNPITDAAEQSVIEQAFQSWQTASGLTFTEVPDGATAASAADIRVGWGLFSPKPGSATDQVGQTNFSSYGGSNAFAPDVVVRLEDPSQVALVPGDGGALTYKGFTATLSQAALHEIGHALGLGHSSDTAAVMSPTATATNRTLDASDIAGIQALYGTAQPCFLRGTRIATPSGAVAVEALRAGDRVCTADGGTLAVVWIGDRRVDARRHPAPDAVLPIRIRAGAFGGGLPVRDLWVSPDHAIFVDGMLVAARLLANGASVAPDPSRAEPHYFHIELTRHAVLLAEGLPAESYLDTGNRASFGTGAVTLHPDFGSLERRAGSCAPFVTDPARIAPLWRRLAGHAGPAGPARGAEALPWLLAGTRRLRPIGTGEALTYALPRGLGSVRLVSGAARPSDSQPWLDDRRVLGTAVERIAVENGTGCRDLALDDPALETGWWPVERAAGRSWRWTAGDARLALPPDAVLLTLRLARDATAAA